MFAISGNGRVLKFENLDACDADGFLQRGIEGGARRSVADSHVQIRRGIRSSNFSLAVRTDANSHGSPLNSNA
jgi:hypothetical protein